MKQYSLFLSIHKHLLNECLTFVHTTHYINNLLFMISTKPLHFHIKHSLTFSHSTYVWNFGTKYITTIFAHWNLILNPTWPFNNPASNCNKHCFYLWVEYGSVERGKLQYHRQSSITFSFYSSRINMVYVPLLQYITHSGHSFTMGDQWPFPPKSLQLFPLDT